MIQNIQIQDQNFVLHPSGALFWEDRSMLLISDVHLGKVSHFRKFGAAVPQNAIYRNFDLLNQSMDCFNPETICFLGDLFHSSINKEWKLFEKWVAQTSTDIILVAGNHDIISPLKYKDLGIRLIDELLINHFLLTHHPEERKGCFNFSGHIHPAVKLRGIGKQSFRLPCFFKTPHQMILPAFGEFTGTHVLKPKKNDEVFAIVDDEVLKI